MLSGRDDSPLIPLVEQVLIPFCDSTGDDRGHLSRPLHGDL